MTKENLKKYHELFTDAWWLFREFADIEDTAEDWERFYAKGRELDAKHNSELFRKIFVAILEDFEERVSAAENA